MSGSIDWAATGDMLSGLGTIVGALAVLLAAYIGRNAISDFRAQKIVEREIGHAENCLTAAYRMQSAISGLRNPMSGGNELLESESELKEKEYFERLEPHEKKRHIAANVYFIRSRGSDEIFKSGFEILPYAKAYFGKDVFVSLKSIIHARHTVLVYADAYAQNEGRDADFTYTIESTIWEGYGKVRGGDELATSLEASITTLEMHLLPIIRASAIEEKQLIATSSP